MLCVCGHGLDSHGDRALPPACEADRKTEPLHRYVEGFLIVSTPPRFHPDSGCPCEGFKRE